MDINKLTPKDLSKEDLVWFIENSPVNGFLTEERIARILASRKAQEVLRLEKRIKLYRKTFKKAPVRMSKTNLVTKHNAAVRRYEKLHTEVEALVDRFPSLTHEEKSE